MVDIIKLIVPEGGEYEIHLNENRTKRQNARSSNNHPRVSIPRPQRNRSRHAVHPAREITLSCPVPTEHRAHDGEGEGDEEPDGKHLFV